VGGARLAFGSAARFSRQRCSRCEPHFLASGHAAGTARAPEPAGSGRDVDVGGGEVGRLGDRLAGVAEAFEVEGDCVAHLALDFCDGGAGGHAAGEVGRVGGVVLARGAFDHDQVAAFGHASSSSPACLMMEAQVFGCKVSDGFPAIVTTPGRLGWRHWNSMLRVSCACCVSP
jgi:hypothetical protein